MLRKLEEALRAAVEAPFAHLFPEKLQPVEMATELRKAMDQARLLTPEGSFAPNVYSLGLSTEEYQQLSSALAALERELAEHLAGYAAGERLRVGPRVQVHLYAGETLSRGQMKAEAEFAPPPEAWLTIDGGLPERGKRFDLGPNMVIGRGSDCEIRLEDSAVSRHHAEIVWQYVQYQVRDLDSANGTFVNGQPVSSALLRDGDLVEVGLVQLRYHSA
ncbi:MAG: DUF3662 and FHA domain-containing protein [Armatimonadia bacterium]